MTSDPDTVLKSFGSSSETTFLLHYSLQLFLSLEEDKTRDAYDIAREDVFALCASPARLPKQMRDFIRWQRTILQLDDGEILETELPRGLKNKYAVKAARLKEMDNTAERETLIRQCLEEQEAYFDKLNEVRAILEATEDRFQTVEDRLLRAESMDDRLISVLSDQKAELEAMRIALTTLRAELEDVTLPDVIKFEGAPKMAWGLMKQLSVINLKTRDAIRQHNLCDQY